MLVQCGLCHPACDPHPYQPLSPNNSVSEIHVVPASCIPVRQLRPGLEAGVRAPSVQQSGSPPRWDCPVSCAPSSGLGGGEFF